MLNKIRSLLLAASSLFVLATFALVPATASADNCPAATGSGADICNNVCNGAQSLALDQSGNTCANTTGGSSTTFNSILAKIINIISVVVGIIAVIMIIVGGLRYVTSAGSSEKVTSAKNTLLYAIIGLIIVALAQVIVKFVLNKATGQS